MQHLAWRLTSWARRGFLRCLLDGGLAHVVTGGRVAVLRAGRSAGAGFAGFRCGCENGQCAVDGPESPPDPCGGQAAGQGRALPGQAQVCSQAAGEPELGVAGEGWVGPGRPAGIAPGGFPRPARRTRRANYSAPGAPRVLPAGQLPVVAAAGFGVHGVGMLLPRWR